MRRKVQTSADRYGEVGVGVDWRLVQDLYHQDKVVDAHRLALSLGASFGAKVLGLYRMVEGEAVTRERGTIREPAPWLHLETVPDETGDDAELAEAVLEVATSVGERLGWSHEAELMISVLVSEADAPWHGARFGYFAPKAPYDKICIPATALRDRNRLREVLVHEYTHFVVHNVTEDRSPEWLQEALAMLVEGESLESCAYPFRVGRAPWLSPEELERAFHGERRDPQAYGRVWHAYQQAGVLGHYLETRQGPEGIRAFLAAFADTTFWQELKMSLTGEPTVEEALRKVFAFGIPQLFDTAHEWIMAR